VFENRVLRKICGPTRDEVRGEWRKFHNEELHDLYFSPTIVLLAVLRKPLKRTPYRIGRQASTLSFTTIIYVPPR
jgi:hypothetical protein